MIVFDVIGELDTNSQDPAIPELSRVQNLLRRILPSPNVQRQPARLGGQKSLKPGLGITAMQISLTKDQDVRKPKPRGDLVMSKYIEQHQPQSFRSEKQIMFALKTANQSRLNDPRSPFCAARLQVLLTTARKRPAYSPHCA